MLAGVVVMSAGLLPEWSSSASSAVHQTDARCAQQLQDTRSLTCGALLPGHS